ncbi:hypothetical protein BJN45_10015 [Azonexus hydrophilus]|uniref:Uncharacterized protein n=1 Tax=Azonexus hydrophilus TaxID=418702 RepID=A0A1R1I4T6_9RHOO|nr:tetratricopeptide repeat protein [Azonexus hydrophilus]OMG53756.1 hypothetical protein BJN45_10015 [Azonexus hydrophilus]
MSLINEVLRKLEEDRPDDPARQNLQREIRSLPALPKSRPRLLRLFILAGLPAMGIAAAVLHSDGRLLPLLGLAGEVAVVAPPPAPVPAPPPEPIAEPPAPVVAVDVQPALISDNLRLALDLAVLPPPATPADAPPANLLRIAEPAVAASVPEKPALADSSSAPSSIEKRPVLATPRDRADAEYRRADKAFAAGHPAEAAEALKAALKHDPTHLQVRQALLRQLLESRKYTEALGVLQDGLEIQPAQIGWAMSLARLQLEQGDFAAADRTMLRSQAYAERNADYAGFQGHLKTRLGEHRLAASHYQRATRLAPNEGRWWLGLGLAQEADGQLPEAREALRRALATGNLSAELVAVAEQHLR